MFRARGRVWTRFWWAYLSFAVAYLVAVLLIDVSWLTRVAGVCNLLVGLGWVVESRGSTIADASGLRLRRLRERVIPWSEVAALQVSGPMPERRRRCGSTTVRPCRSSVCAAGTWTTSSICAAAHSRPSPSGTDRCRHSLT